MEALREAIRSFRFGPAVTHRNLTVFPLLGKAAGKRQYVTLGEALAAGSARVTEVSEGGRVPELTLVNDGKDPVLLVDGEELRGAKQNRVLNLTLLVAAGKSLVIPVSCVEAGRWVRRSVEFECSPNALFARARAEKMCQVSASMESGRGYASDQGEVWHAIHAKLACLGTPSPTSAMEEAYTQRSGDVEEYVAALGPVAGQAGAVFALDGRVVGCEMFDHPATLGLMMAKLVRSYALDAIETAGRACEAPPAEAARAFLDELADARMEVSPALGMGEDVRISGERLVGAALVSEGNLVHLSAFRLAENGGRGKGEEDGPRMASYRVRRGSAGGRGGGGRIIVD